MNQVDAHQSFDFGRADCQKSTLKAMTIDAASSTQLENEVRSNEVGKVANRYIPERGLDEVPPGSRSQAIKRDLRRRPLGRKPGRKRWQKTAEACRRLQVTRTQETLKNMLGNTGFLEVRRGSQLGYGDLIVTS